jgi:hypothetical protein
VKIILVDNFDRKRPSASDDVRIADNVSEHYAEAIATALNEKFNSTPSADYIFKAVADDYKLRKYG